MAKLIVFLILLSMDIGNSILSGWAASLMYRWHVMPLFPSAPFIGVGHMIGLSCLFGLFTMKARNIDTKENDVDIVVKQILYAMAIFIILFIGYMAS